MSASTTTFIIIVTQAFILNTLPEIYVPLGLALLPNASIVNGTIEGWEQTELHQMALLVLPDRYR